MRFCCQVAFLVLRQALSADSPAVGRLSRRICIYQERVREIIQPQVGNRIQIHLTPPTTGAPDLVEQIRLSLAQFESKKPDAKPSKKPVRKTPTLVKSAYGSSA